MTIHEIRCDAVYTDDWGHRVRCRRRFQTLDRPVESTAEEYGWLTGDLTLCPTHLQEGAARILAAVDGCDHAESLYGRCVACGMTWQQQAVARG